MSQVWVQLSAAAALLLIVPVSTVLSAPNIKDEDLKLISSDDIQNIIEGHQNDSTALMTSDDVSTENVHSGGPRTLIIYGLLSWLFGVVKAMIKPARNMYIMMAPEISAIKCLSESREFQSFMGFSGGDSEGYVYETPRSSGRRLPSPEHQNPIDQRFLSDLFFSQYHLIDQPDALNSPEYNSLHDPTGYSVSQSTQHRTDEVLKRIPRFVDEFASLLKEGQSMNCIMPYMRERVTRWLDS